MEMKLPQSVITAINTIEAAGFEAYVIGGCVRDFLMGKQPHDFDIATSALPQETEEIFSDRKVIETGIKHGTVTVIINRVHLEITTYRIDGEYHDSRHPDSVSFTRSLENDISRRDFTMNGIAYNPKCGFVDLCGGAEDIKNGVIRCIGSPEKRLSEDALRIMRALRFSCTSGFSIEENTAKACYELKGLLKNIAAERIFEELCKALGCRFFSVFDDFRDIIAEIIPEIAPAFDFEQYSRYHRYDVYRHIIKSAQAAADITKGKENCLPLTLAMLLHDTGKPHCFTRDENGEGHFYGHAKISADIADIVMRRFKSSNALRERVCAVVKYHDLPLSEDRRLIKKHLSKFGAELYNDIILAHCADDMAKTPESEKRCERWYKIRALAEEISAEGSFDLKSLAINGKDLSELIKPSPLTGEVLKYLLSGVLEEKFPNEREILLQESKKYLEKNGKL